MTDLVPPLQPESHLVDRPPVTALDPGTAALLRDLTSMGATRDERFERIARITARLFGVEAAYVSLLDEKHQWIKGCVGLGDIESWPRDDTFCQYAVVSGRLLLVPDLREDRRFAKHPIVTQGGFLFYVGQPLRVRGHVVGTLCLMDKRVRDLSAAERESLADLATWAETEILAAETAVAERRRPGASVLQTVHRRDELILQFVATAICGVDNEGFVTFANPAAAELLGDDLENLVGAHFSSTYSRLNPDGTTRSWAGTAAAEVLRTGGTCRNVVETLQRADGARLEVEYAAAPLVVDSEVLGLVVTFSDVSGRRAIERLKDEFVSVVSHELRTPLTSIRGSLGLLASGRFGGLPAQGARLVEIALDNTERLVRLVNDILDLERIEAGRADLHPRLQSLAPLLATAVDGVAGVAQEVGVTVTTSTSRPALTVEVDADFIVRAFTNLIGNAVKFSRPGGTVALDASRAGGEVRVSVTDRGRGIPSDRLERVFERFEQVDASDNREKGGTGLGLAITRSIVERHGGRIEVVSELGVGSTFTVVLPAPPVAPARPDSAESRGASVVIVDDDDDIVEVLSTALRQDGIEVASARGVQEAVELVTRLHPALVVLDVQLADGDGYEVAARLREDPELADTPLVVATVHDLDDAERARLVLGATTVVAKATTGPDLVAAVLAAVRRHVRPPARTPDTP